MDDIFAVISIACLLLWMAALVAARMLPAAATVQRMVKGVYEWRGFFIALIAIALFRICLYEMFWIPSASMQPTLREGEFVIVDKNAYGIRMPIFGQRITTGINPERGEIVVFRHPQDEEIFYIKRIIGLPGDKLVIDGNTVMINGKRLDYQGPVLKNYVYSEQRSAGFIDRLWKSVSFADKTSVTSVLYWEQLSDGWHPLLLSDPFQAPAALLSNQFCTNNQPERRLECIVPQSNFFVLGDNRHRSNDSRYWGFVPRTHLVGPAKMVALSLDRIDRSFSSLKLKRNPERFKDILVPEPGEQG